ncbi:MAG: glycerate kinase [Candidatus Tectomicrobia bacterium]|nr:glycerate kinase [Candidatus Tectomicrobia bacterium]
MAELRSIIHEIFQAALRAVDPEEAIKRHIRRSRNWLEVGEKRYDLSTFKKISIIGMGKATAPMATALEGILGDDLTSGIIIVKYGHVRPLSKITIYEAGHPLPDEAGVQGAKKIIQLLKETGEDDLVICLISGGGSALLPAPVHGISLEEKQSMTQLLLKCGATIREINTIRKHISQVKGGRLARLVFPSTLISLILSDVVGDSLEVIASGPTVPDRTTFADALSILKKYQIQTAISSSVLSHLEEGVRGGHEETPKEGDPIFANTQEMVIGSNIQALQAARERAEASGFHTLILSSFIEGETREVSRMHTAIVKEILSSGNPLPPPACLLSGGETTVTVRGSGSGGRNQEFTLASAIEIEGLRRVVLLSGGTDGTDGPTEAAGAIADGSTVARARGLGLDPFSYLENNDSYHFFKKLGDLLITGPTNTNVMDLRIFLIE